MSKKGGVGKFIGGLAIGAGLGLLFSPDTGENNRKVLAKKIDELLKKLKEVDLEEVKDELLYRAETLQAELANLDSETAKEIVLEKAEVIKEWEQKEYIQDLKEIQEEKRNKNYTEQIQDLKNENASLKKELELTQEAVNEILFNTLGGE